MSVPKLFPKFAPVVLAALCALLPATSSASLIWAPVGTALSPANFVDSNASDGLQAVNLGAQYAFPFEGTTYQSINVTTSGFIWLGGINGSQCCILGSPSAALNDFENNAARIAPVWADLRPDLGGSIDVNQITDASGSRTVITYLNVPTSNPANSNATVSFQVQLFTTGEIIFSYEQFAASVLGSNAAAVIGLTNGVNGPGTMQSVDFTNLTTSGPFSSPYDYLQASSGFNLSGDSFIFTPFASTDQFLLTSASPEPSTLIPIAGAFFFSTVISFIRQKRNSKY